jgi:Fe-S-cluster containining protein
LKHFPIHHDDPNLASFFDRLKSIFTAMDRQYAEIAGHYGFQCNGCEDNCCRTRFYHHTYLEYLYIHSGFNNLAIQTKQEILSRAGDVCRNNDMADEKHTTARAMCPLNFDGLCSLYNYRPMICRLHGIPHEIRKPGQNIVRGPGCGMFAVHCSDKRYRKFDRTPIYFAMAKLESELKQALGLTSKIKLTIAEMIMGKAHSA